MSLFAAWTGVVLGAARIDPPAAAAPEVPEPRRFHLAYNPVPPAAPIPTPAPARRLVAEPAPVSTRRLCLEK
ncbi:hypothetical protein J2848_003913 [Azospirillum lipoferum]|uniref:Uncharacterized protein n=1 Tax=Azospirillum lipoferum TaxID=193 RepID=A0A5A9GD04_AZOLI|nr:MULTISPECIES: hypothetical protein [Azospirillum]KAA0592276.1 hypothetical protein FZ942_29100 [Azospirillum lipoferum]MCP1612233.1 hypothetical protein [Azospirillum lipoferum]MDW5536545.1 hypothetical protein [Azospirillum sp. NL1]